MDFLSALIPTSGCGVIHDHIRQMKKRDVARCCLEPSPPRVHTDIKWSDDNCQLRVSCRLALLAVNNNTSKHNSRVSLPWQLKKQLNYVDILMWRHGGILIYISIYVVRIICFQWAMILCCIPSLSELKLKASSISFFCVFWQVFTATDFIPETPANTLIN